jgi:pimeloyl-ACP methyl ester carboxylesterase
MNRVAGLVVAVLVLGCASSAHAAGVTWIPGYAAPGTPKKLDRVGVVKVGPSSALNVLVLEPGTSAGAAYFVPMAKALVGRLKGWQVWAVERRENQLEDQTVLDQAKAGKASAQQLFDYYLGFITNPNIAPHFQLIPDASVAFAKQWGMRTTVEDLRRVIAAARKGGRRVVLGGHSLGGSIVTAYATWDFNGRAGVKDLAGLVYIDGGSSPAPVTPAAARKSLQALQKGSPWLTFGGIAAPFAGLFNIVGSTLAHVDPNGASLLAPWPALPANLRSPIPVTNVGGYGRALDTATSPAPLVAAQAHLGRLAASGDPRGWDDAGELTPIQRYADMFSGTGLQGVDGTAWYHPQRLTVDAGAVADGNANAAQKLLGVRATHGDDVDVPIYAFAAALGGTRVLTAARALARQSHLERRDLTLVDRHTTYAHNDPAGAFPKNDFLSRLVTFLGPLGKG